MSENAKFPRRTSRATAGKPPSRHGDWVCNEKINKQLAMLVPDPEVCCSNATPTTRTVTMITNNNSVNSTTGQRESVKPLSSKGSICSFQSNFNTVRRLNLQAEFDAQAKLNELNDEEDRINAAILELEKKKILRSKKLAEKALDLERSKIEEEYNANSDAESLVCSHDDAGIERNVNSQVRQNPNQNCETWVNNTPIRNESEFYAHQPPQHPDEVPLVYQFQMFSQCIANAITSSHQVSARPKEKSELNKFVARQTGAKDLPFFTGDSEEWPSFFAAYKRSTESCEFNDDDNLVRLQKCLRGKAKEAVQGLLIAPENVSHILRVLQRKFGQPATIIENMVRKVQNLPRVRDDRPDQLVEFSSSIENLAATIESLNRPQYLQNPILLKEVVGKLPFHLSLRWGEKVAACLDDGKELHVKDFACWLAVISDAVSVSNIVTSVPEKNEAKLGNRGNKRETVMTTSTTTDKKHCILCKKNGHKMDECKQFIKLNNDDRWKEVKSKRVCFCCLETGHNLTTCSKKKSCSVEGCQRPHHKLLHLTEKKESRGITESAAQPSITEVGTSGAEPEKVMVTRLSENPTVMMKVIPVKLYGPARELDTYAVFDDCATCSLLDESVASTLGLKGVPDPLLIQGTSTLTHSDSNSKRVQLEISRDGSDEKFYLERIRTVKGLNLPVQSINMKLLKRKWSHLPEIDLASFSNAKPSILLGQDYADLTVSREVIDGPSQGPILSRTKLGWVIHGNNANIRDRIDSEYVCLTVDNEDKILHDLMKSHYALESIGVMYCAEKVKPREVARAEELLNSSTKRLGNRFETGLLWKYDNVQLPESKSQALRRLKSVERKMDNDASYARLYSEKMEDYVKKGYARELTSEEASVLHPRINYLAHFGVTNPNKPGKLRIVFDAAAKSCGLSLNDHLLSGPDYYNALPGVFFKFREKEIAIAADIREMFPQIKIRSEDSLSQRYLWRGTNRSNNPTVYEMTSMVFGVISSPSSAQFVKNKNAEDFKDEFPEACDMIIRRHYMDDGLSSCHTEVEALKLARDVIFVHSQGGFQICNWVSNSKFVLEGLPQELVSEKVKSIGLKEEEHSERILGQKWKPFQDVLYFCIDLHKVPTEVKNFERKPTKGEVLQLTMSIFDPIGLLANFTIQPKILLQEIWRTGGDWKAELPDNLVGTWKRFLKQLKTLETLTIPRCYSPKMKDVVSIQLHIFSDASTLAYAAIAYLRLEFPGEFTTAFVMAKSRVAPLKSTSIPRLELQAAVMGTRMAKFIADEHSLKFGKVHFWTDSTTVLCWIRSDSRQFKTFVANRIGEIEDTTTSSQWHWVPTKENVADEATRTKEEITFSADSRWFNGPDFLKMPEEKWPEETHNNKKPPNSNDLEIKKEFVCVTVPADDGTLPDINRFSKLMRLLRVTAWSRRYLTHLKKSYATSEELTTVEIKNAENLWIRNSQVRSFPEEFQLLRKNKPIHSTSRLLTLSPYIDNQGIMRVKSRIENSPDIDDTAKYPAILDPLHPFTKLLINWYHCKYEHQGRELVVNELRQIYWILNIRSAVKSCWNNCQICKNWRAKPQVPIMAALPEVRVKRCLKAFINTGLDCFGPMLVKIGRRTEKRYGLLFTCLTTRAIHIELLASMATDSTILAIRRFIARRGPPAYFYSDNGTNFRGADNELQVSWKQLDFTQLQSKFAKATTWSFIPPATPHFGGAWERLIKSVKTALKFTLKEQCPREEILLTLLCEAEFMVNSRPITHVSNDHNDPEALTPNHFLLGSSGSAHPPGKFSDSDLLLKKQWRHGQRLADLFWKRWVREYLPTLTKRNKWNSNQRPVQINDVVIIADENSPRNLWPKGIITSTFPGKDGEVRVVDVRTRTGVYRRPVAKLIVLDVRSNGE